jgi:hypothetical protein
MKVENIMTNNRVCLKVNKWGILYKAISDAFPNRQIPKPPTAENWTSITNERKKILFCMHLELSIISGVSDSIFSSVNEDDWFKL